MSARQVATGSLAFEPVMNEQDEAMWLLEDDPVMRSTITAVAILDRHPDRPRLERRLLEAAARVPRLRERVVERPLGLGPPRWVDAGPPDLRYHLRHVRAPAHGSLDAVLRIAEPIAMSVFDPARPLWEFTVVDGLSGGRAALVQKVHHSLADGIAAVELAMFLYDNERIRPRTAPIVELPQATTDGTRPRRLLPDVGPAIGALRDPVAAITRATATAGSLARLLAPAPHRLSPLFTGHGLVWRFDAFDTPLDAWRQAAAGTGATINDVFLAAVAGGVRRYHERFGFNVDGVRLTLPVNIRAEDDPLGGNHFTPVRFVLPINEPNPIERIRQLSALSRRWRSEPALRLTERIAAMFNRMPRAVGVPILASLFKSTDVTATNVPAFTAPVYLAGAKLTELYAFAPPSGAAVNIALLSYADTACIGINADVAAVTDPAALAEELAKATDEVLALGSSLSRVAS